MAWYRSGSGGESLTDELNAQKTDVEALAKYIADIQNDANGTYVWGKYASNGGDLLDYVSSSSESAYPDGGTSGGHYYKRVRAALTGISVATMPAKTNYAVGNTFDPTGMVVVATYETGRKKEVTNYTYSPKTLNTVGTRTVTISYTENGVTKTTAVQVNVVAIGNFASMTWPEIRRAIQQGIAGTDLTQYWAVGDTNSVTLTTGETIELQISDFNHDTYADGITAPVSLVMKNCLNAQTTMNSSSTNSGGYPASGMKTYVNTNIYEKFPKEFKDMVAQVKKKSYTTYNSASSLKEEAYYVWLLSEMEVFGVKTYGTGAEDGTLYPIFTDAASRIKKCAGSASNWWLRTPNSYSSYGFCFVNSSGTASYNNAISSNGVAVGLCIR